MNQGFSHNFCMIIEGSGSGSMDPGGLKTYGSVYYLKVSDPAGGYLI
jgi:hypothetical protein